MPKVSSYSPVSSIGSGDSIYVIQGGQSRKALLNVPIQFGGNITLGTDGSNTHIINGNLRLIANNLTSVFIERQGQDKMLLSVGVGSYIDSFDNAQTTHTLLAFTGSEVELWAGPGLAGQAIALRAVNGVNAINYIEVSGSATNQPVSFEVKGEDANVGVFYATKGSGVHSFGVLGSTQVIITGSDSAVNNLTLFGAATSAGVGFKATGTDTNIPLQAFYKNESNFEVWSYAGAISTLISALGSESPISSTSRRYLTFLGLGGATINMEGTTCDLLIRNSAGNILQLSGVASGANWLQVVQSTTGNPVVLTPGGAEADIILSLTGKGVSPTVVTSDLEVRGATAVQNIQSNHYTLVAADANKSVYHPASDNNPRTFTIPANASVPFKIGTMVTFVNRSTSNVTIAITTDTMYLAVTGTTGSRTLATNGVANALKISATEWLIAGQGLT